MALLHVGRLVLNMSKYLIRLSNTSANDHQRVRMTRRPHAGHSNQGRPCSSQTARRSFPHLLTNLITDHKPFVSRECVETAIDALVNRGRLGLRFEKLTSLVRFFLAFFLLLIM